VSDVRRRVSAGLAGDSIGKGELAGQLSGDDSASSPWRTAGIDANAGLLTAWATERVARLGP
jgi:hypothetical protein